MEDRELLETVLVYVADQTRSTPDEILALLADGISPEDVALILIVRRMKQEIDA